MDINAFYHCVGVRPFETLRGEKMQRALLLLQKEDIIIAVLKKVAAIWFDHVSWIDCGYNRVGINLKNSASIDMRAHVIVYNDRIESYASNKGKNYNFDVFVFYYKELLGVAARFRREYHAVIFARLPQPIAEEICAEFILE